MAHKYSNARASPSQYSRADYKVHPRTLCSVICALGNCQRYYVNLSVIQRKVCSDDSFTASAFVSLCSVIVYHGCARNRALSLTDHYVTPLSHKQGKKCYYSVALKKTDINHHIFSLPLNIGYCFEIGAAP